MKKVLLTGASGSVGFQTFKELLRRKDRYQTRIICLDRAYERKLFRPYHNKLEIFWGDLRNPVDVSRAAKGVDVVLHVAGIIPPASEINPALAKAVNVNGTRNLVEVCQSQRNFPKFIFTSSVSVYGDRINNPGIRVGDALNPSDGDEYARTKIEAEAIIQNSDLPWVIFRLCGILVKRLKVQPLMFHMPLETDLEWCHDTDAGYALVQAIDEDALVGKIFNLGGGERCRIKARDFLSQMLPLWGLNPKILPDYAFATQNFHSGYYLDGGILNDILHFRRITLQDYIKAMKKRISPLLRLVVGMIPGPIIRAWMLKMSDPLKAIHENNVELVARFYGSREIYERILHREKVTVHHSD